MYGAIRAQFINAESQDFTMEGKEITAHYVTVIDEHAFSIHNKYTQLKVSDEVFKTLKLGDIATLKSLQGKTCQFDGTLEKSQKRVRLASGEQVSVPAWEFHVTGIKEVASSTPKV